MLNSFQEIFDAVVTHARKQKKRCLYNDKCMYRDPEDSFVKCFIGALIPDTKYDKKIENISVSGLLSPEFIDLWKGVLLKSLLEDKIKLSVFLAKLQKIHDDHYVMNWDRAFSKLAKDYNLVYTRQPIGI